MNCSSTPIPRMQFCFPNTQVEDSPVQPKRAQSLHSTESSPTCFHLRNKHPPSLSFLTPLLLFWNRQLNIPFSSVDLRSSSASEHRNANVPRLSLKMNDALSLHKIAKSVKGYFKKQNVLWHFHSIKLRMGGDSRRDQATNPSI